jgi:hypothetical protein
VGKGPFWLSHDSSYPGDAEARAHRQWFPPKGTASTQSQVPESSSEVFVVSSQAVTKQPPSN